MGLLLLGVRLAGVVVLDKRVRPPVGVKGMEVKLMVVMEEVGMALLDTGLLVVVQGVGPLPTLMPGNRQLVEVATWEVVMVKITGIQGMEILVGDLNLHKLLVVVMVIHNPGRDNSSHPSFMLFSLRILLLLQRKSWNLWQILDVCFLILSTFTLFSSFLL